MEKIKLEFGVLQTMVLLSALDQYRITATRNKDDVRMADALYDYVERELFNQYGKQVRDGLSL